MTKRFGVLGCGRVGRRIVEHPTAEHPNTPTRQHPNTPTPNTPTPHVTFRPMATAAIEVSELQAEIKELARVRNACILAHNYERPEVQDVAHFVGDSLGLSREAAKTDA